MSTSRTATQRMVNGDVVRPLTARTSLDNARVVQLLRGEMSLLAAAFDGRFIWTYTQNRNAGTRAPGMTVGQVNGRNALTGRTSLPSIVVRSITGRLWLDVTIWH